MTNEQRLDLAKKLIFEVWDDLVPDYPVEDEYYDQIGNTASRIISDITDMHSFADYREHHGSPKWNWDLP